MPQPNSLSWYFCLFCMITIQISLLFIEQSKVTSISGPLHLLFPQLWMFFLQMITCNVRTLHQISAQASLPQREVISDNTIWNRTILPVLLCFLYTTTQCDIILCTYSFIFYISPLENRYNRNENFVFTAWHILQNSDNCSNEWSTVT